MTQAQVSAARQQAEVWIRTHSHFQQIPAYPIRAALCGVNLATFLRNRGDADEGRSLHRSLECPPRQDLSRT